MTRWHLLSTRWQPDGEGGRPKSLGGAGNGAQFHR